MDREKAIQSFKEYTDKYDSTDTKICLKIEHSFKVCEIAEQIARALSVPLEDVELAWLMGLLHDIGRFEQLRQYGTFIDANSIDHAKLSADILFRDGLIEEYRDESLPDGWESICEKAIRLHNKLLLPEDLDERELIFCNILRDADKADIFRVLAEIPYEKRVSSESAPRRDRAREDVMDCVRAHRCVPRFLERTKHEALISQCCMAFELVFDKSRQIVKEQGNLKRLIEQAKAEATTPETEQLSVLEGELKKAGGIL
ncbi:MAG: HD domain-containing protein [Lachnospiraceae bacterium]|nr:HD domain-containing protein [Lachnospiraceae bacterium]